MAVQLRSGKELEKIKEKNDSSKEEESPEKEEALEKKKEGVDKKDIKGSRPTVPFPQRLHRGVVCKVFENLSKARNKYAIYRSGDSDATLCKIPEGHAEQEKKDSRRRDCESHCYLQYCDEERIAIKDEGSSEFCNSLHHWRS